MSELHPTRRKIPWHRTKLDRELLVELNRQSDVLGFAQTLGYLGTLVATGAFAWWVSLAYAWYWFLPAWFLHGMCFSFSVNGFHELVHNTAFRTRWLNSFFCCVILCHRFPRLAQSDPLLGESLRAPPTYALSAR